MRSRSSAMSAAGAEWVSAPTLMMSTPVAATLPIVSRLMPPDAAQLLADVLALPAEQRRELVAEVLATLDDGPSEDPSVVAAAWSDEIHRRIERRKAGLSSDSAWPEMRDRLLAELRARRGDPGR